MTEKRYTFAHVTIMPAENGYLVYGQLFNAALTFVAKDMGEVVALLGTMDISVNAREEGGYAGKLRALAEAASQRPMRDPSVPPPPTEPYPGADMTTGMSARAFGGLR